MAIKTKKLIKKEPEYDEVIAYDNPKVVEEMEKRGMRKDVHIMCGGAPLNQEFADSIGVPAYGRDAARSAEMAEEHVRGLSKKRAHR